MTDALYGLAGIGALAVLLGIAGGVAWAWAASGEAEDGRKGKWWHS